MPAKRLNLRRRAWLTVRLWALLYQLDSAERYLHECEHAGITEGRGLDLYLAKIDEMTKLARAIDKELDQ